MSPVRAVYVVCLSVLYVASPAVGQNVSVIRQQLSFDEEHTLPLDDVTEYILEFVPDEESEWPSRVWASSEAVSLQQPLLITARQRTGAVTWQLPYKSGESVLHELERTLCPPDTGDAQLDSDCGVFSAGMVSLHVGAACARAELRVRVRRATDWRLPFHTETHLELTQAKPLVYSYQFMEEQNSVRLMVTSEDDVCVTVSVQEYMCPIKQTLQEIDGDFLYSTRMTVQRSGLVQLSRSSYPRGAEGVFYVVMVVHDSDDRCTREQVDRGEDDAEAATREPGLWESAVLRAATPTPVLLQRADEMRRLKRVFITIEAALTRTQFAVAAGGTLAVYALCYLALAGALLARRWPACARLVAPRAVLAPPPAPSPAPTPQNADRSEVDATTNNDVETASRPRRSSEATFDDSDMSDSDSDDEEIRAAPDEPDRAASDRLDITNNTQGSPVTNGALRLPARLRLAGLARRRARVLSARSRRFLPALLTVAVFYALPVVQFVAAFQIFLNVSGSLDACYYNYLCAHRLGAVADFNHVLSNLGYMLLGGLFVLQVELRRRRRVRAPRHEEYGIPPHYGLSMALGVCLMLVGVFSGIYHVCPNSLNFQFDTAFMYVLAALVMVKTFMARHPDVAPRAHAAFAALAVLIALAVWGVLGGGALFWAVATVLHVASFLMLSVHIYYLGQFRLEKEILQSAARELVSLKPLYRTRLVMLLIANAINWAFAIYGLIEQPSNFASHLLQVLLANALMYVVVYLAMKVSHGERLRWYAWCWAGGAAAAWAPALYLFTAAPARWDLSAAHARHHNQPCLLLDFYDAHDLWHLLSAFALYLTFNMLLTWDDGLAAVKRTEIAVF